MTTMRRWWWWWWCGDLRHKSSRQEAIIRTFRIFNDGHALGDVETLLMHIKETVSFNLDKVTGFLLTTVASLCASV